MANTLFSCLSCNTLYATFYEIEAHLLHDPCHDHDNQELYDTYGTSEYLHVMVTKINVLINMPEQVEGNADQVEDKRESKEEEEERQWEEKLFQQLCMGIQDDEDSGLREDQVNSITSAIDRLNISVHTLDCTISGMDCPRPNGTHVPDPLSSEMQH